MSEIIQRLLLKKSLLNFESIEARTVLKRTLSAWDLTAIGIGSIIGVGIFVLPGVEAAKHAGPGIILSFVLAAVACAFTALCYAEMTAMIPVSGSAYTYGYVALGEVFAWIIGWDLLLEYMFTISLVAVGWSSYCTDLLESLGVAIPYQWRSSPFAPTPGYCDAPALIIVALVTSVIITGIKESARLNNLMVLIKLTAITLFVILTARHINPVNWKPFMPFGFSGVMTAASIVFIAYIGFDAVSTAAEEAKNPQSTLPKGILFSLCIATILYILVAAIMTGTVRYQILGVPDPMALVLKTLKMPTVGAFICLAAIAGMTSVIISMMIAQPRIIFAMARDGLLPTPLAKIHPRFNTPYLATLLTGAVAAIMASMLPIQALAELTSIGTLFAFVIVCGGVMILRRTNPETPRPFRVPFAPFVTTAGVISCGALMASLPFTTWIRFAVWLLLGALIYAFYGFRNSILNGEIKNR